MLITLLTGLVLGFTLGLALRGLTKPPRPSKTELDTLALQLTEARDVIRDVDSLVNFKNDTSSQLVHRTTQRYLNEKL